MPISNRLFFKGRLVRVSQTVNLAGGLSDNTRDTIISSFNYHRFNVTPHDRELIMTDYGLEKDAVIYLAYANYDSNIKVNDVIIDLDSDGNETSTHWRIAAVSPQYGRNATPSHLSMTIYDEGEFSFG